MLPRDAEAPDLDPLTPPSREDRHRLQTVLQSMQSGRLLKPRDLPVVVRLGEPVVIRGGGSAAG
jgi:hypothetical protein